MSQVEEKSSKNEDRVFEKDWWPIVPPWTTPDWMKGETFGPHALNMERNFDNVIPK